MEPDPDDAEWTFLVAYQRKRLDPMVIGDVGAIINSTRTALDILMSALLVRHGKKPNSEAHFPIRKTAADFLDAVNVLEGKQWIDAAEAATIKNTKAYDGGDKFLYAIHKLDILRKHERLLVVDPSVGPAHLTTLIDSPSYLHHQALKDKTILYRIPSRFGFSPSKGNTLLAAEIFFNEPTLLVTQQPAIGVLRNFCTRVRTLIEGFP